MFGAGDDGAAGADTLAARSDVSRITGAALPNNTLMHDLTRMHCDQDRAR
jgi:hypothetical protein